jgi:hypothetical protein
MEKNCKGIELKVTQNYLIIFFKILKGIKYLAHHTPLVERKTRKSKSYSKKLI